MQIHTSTVRRQGEAPLTVAWSDYIPLLDKGFIRLEGALASDLDPVNAARVSFGERRPEMDDKDRGLVNFLARERHGTPFEHSFLRWEVKAPLFVFREWHRHRVGNSYNEQSGRYMELEREFYIPARDQVREQKGKPGAYYYERIEDDEKAELFQHDLRTASEFAFDEYQSYLSRGIAKEQARMILPVNTYSTMWWSDNPRSLMAFLSLRNAPNAQWEIQQYAKAAEEVFAQVMPVTAQAFIEHGRLTP